MNNTTVTPIRVPSHDNQTRRRAAATVGKAYIGHPLWWLNLILFAILTSLLAQMAWQAHRDEFGTSWTVSLTAGALVCVAVGFAYVPLSMALIIYRARDLYYLDTGRARAALATKPDNRRDALTGDVQAHSFGAWPHHAGAGGILGEWVRDQVHAQGGRLTATALPGTARTYRDRGMVDDGRTARFLPRVASKPRRASDNPGAQATHVHVPDQTEA